MHKRLLQTLDPYNNINKRSTLSNTSSLLVFEYSNFIITIENCSTCHILDGS